MRHQKERMSEQVSALELRLSVLRGEERTVRERVNKELMDEMSEVQVLRATAFVFISYLSSPPSKLRVRMFIMALSGRLGVDTVTQ
jgi:hypothetical protein